MAYHAGVQREGIEHAGLAARVVADQQREPTQLELGVTVALEVAEAELADHCGVSIVARCRCAVTSCGRTELALSIRHNTLDNLRWTFDLGVGVGVDPSVSSDGDGDINDDVGG